MNLEHVVVCGSCGMGNVLGIREILLKDGLCVCRGCYEPNKDSGFLKNKIIFEMFDAIEDLQNQLSTS